MENRLRTVAKTYWKDVIVLVGVGLVGWHLWQDHQKLHLIDLQVGAWQRAAAAQAPQQPAQTGGS